MKFQNTALFRVFCKAPRGRVTVAMLGALLSSCSATHGDETDDGANSNGGLGGKGGPGFEVPGAGDGGLLPGPKGSAGAGGPGGPGGDQKTCGFDTIALERLPAELLLVLDRSTSMVNERGADGRTNWTILTKSVDSTIMKTQGGVLWGLKTFPTTSGCNVGAGVEHNVVVNNYGAISGTIMGAMPGRSNATPTTAAMKSAAMYLKGRATPNPKYILLATDGEPNCLNGNSSNRNGENDDIDGAIAAVDAATKEGFHTFVVGVAPQRQSGRALDTLNKMAVAGAEPRAGDTKFFSVISEEELTTALSAIAGQVGSCSFNLSKMPPSPDDVAVDIDGKRIAQSPVNGWQYNAMKTAIVLNGALCEEAKLGKLKNVKITFGCPGVIIPVL